MREPREQTAARVGCSREVVALHERDHRCWDEQIYTRPPCLLTDPARRRELAALLATTSLVHTGR